MAKKGRKLEKLISRIEKAINPNDVKITSPDFLPDKDTGVLREIDVSIRYLNLAHPFIITIECRNRSKTPDVRWIEQLVEKRKSIGVDKTIAVSTSGFSKPAQIKAKQNNIPTLNLTKLPTGLEKIILDPVMIIDHHQSSINAIKINVDIDPSKKSLLKKFQKTNKLPAHKIKLYKKSGQKWGDTGQLLNKQLPNKFWEKVLENGRLNKTIVINFRNPKDTLFIKTINQLLPLSSIIMKADFWIDRQKSLFKINALTDSDKKVIAQHAETTFTFNDIKTTFSLTKGKKNTVGQVNLEKVKKKPKAK